MKFLKAKDISASTVSSVPHQFSTAIIQRKSPGIYTYMFGRGKMEAESVVSFFLVACNDVNDITQELDHLSALLRSPSFVRDTFHGIFPKLSQTLQDGFTVTTTPDLQKILIRAAGDKSSAGLIALLQEIHLEMFADQRFILPSKGSSFREFRPERIPSYVELAKDCVRNELTQLINETKLRIKISGFKYTPASLMAEYERILSDLGRKVAQIGYTLNYFYDALHCVKTYFLQSADLVNLLPRDILQSTEFSDLLANMTFVEIALNPLNEVREGNNTPAARATSIVQAARMLNQSTRYQVVTLRTAIAPYRYSSVVDERSNVVGGVLSYATKFFHPVVVGMFDEIPELLNATQTTVLNRETTDITTLLAPLAGKDPGKFAHTGCFHLMSAITLDETDPENRSTLAVIDTLSESDLKHIAAAYADGLYITPSDSRSPGDCEIVFARNLRKKRVLSDSLPFEGIVYTNDPATLILALDDFDSDIPLDMTNQDVPPELWDMFILPSSLPLQKNYHRERIAQVDIGGSPISVTIDLASLLRHNPRNCAGVLYNPLSQKVITSTIDGILKMYLHVIGTIKDDEEQMKMATGLGAQACHMLSAVITESLNSSLFHSMVEDIVRRFVRKASPRQKDLTYKQLHRVNYRRQIELILAFLVMTRMNILPHPDDATMASSVENEVLAFLNGQNYFDMLIGTDFARLASE